MAPKDSEPGLALDILEEVRWLLSMLADAEESGGGDVSRYVSGELKGLDFSVLQKFIDGNLDQGKLPRDTESALKKLQTSTTTLTRRIASIDNQSRGSGTLSREGDRARADAEWNDSAPTWRSPRFLGTRKRKAKWSDEQMPSPKVRALVTVKGQGDLLIYSSATPLSVTARKIVKGKSVEESAAQALAGVVVGGEARAGVKVKEEAEEGEFAGIDGGALVLGQDKWVERGEAVEWPFTYSESSGELVVTLPPMSEVRNVFQL